MRVAAWLGCGLVLLGFLPGCAAERAADTVSCSPGATLVVGCNQACGLGSCAGDPSLRVCDGDTPTAACTEGTRLIEVDDTPAPCASSCPVAVLTCPASGRITVVPITLSSISACDWGVEERTDALPTDASVGDADASMSTDGGPSDGSVPSDAAATDGGKA